MDQPPVLKVDQFDYAVYTIECSCSCDQPTGEKIEWFICLIQEPTSGGLPGDCINANEIMYNKINPYDNREIGIMSPGGFLDHDVAILVAQQGKQLR